MVILDLEVLSTISKHISKNLNHQKDARRNSVKKDVLNSSPSFFSASLVKKTLMETNPLVPGIFPCVPNFTFGNLIFGRGTV